MAAPKRNAKPAGQGTIAFDRQARRSASGPPAAVHKGKSARSRPQLSPRVQPAPAQPAPAQPAQPAAKSAASAQDVGEILNGRESRALLRELRKDRFEYPRFHQEHLSVAQQLLRQFDMIQDYGPCQGLTRMQRWDRAEKFGKRPPPHVKAVLEAAQSLPDYADEYELSVFGPLH